MGLVHSQDEEKELYLRDFDKIQTAFRRLNVERRWNQIERDKIIHSPSLPASVFGPSPVIPSANVRRGIPTIALHAAFRSDPR